MIDYIPSTVVGASNTSSGGLNGIDLLTSIQILMVQDYDNQLKSMGRQIKGTTKVKQLYRQDIEQIQKLLARKTEKKNDKECVALTPEEFSKLNMTNEYIYDAQKDKITTNTTYESGEAYIGSQKTDTYTSGSGKNQKTVVSRYWVERDAIDKKIENYKLKLESLNEQSELMSLGLQSLTNQRKIAFETISTLVNKQHDSVATIIRNIKS